MSPILKSFALFLSFAGLLLGATNANALACTSAATGNWNAAATWLAPCNVAGGPVAADTVTIAAAHTVTVTANAAATSITIAAPSVAHGININPGIALNVSVAITMTAPAANFASTLAVGSGTLTAGSIAINGGTAGTRISQVTVSTGTITVTGGITSGGTLAQARFISTGASMTNVGGNFTPGALTAGAGMGTINFNGTGAAQSMGAFATYNNVTIANTNAAGVVTMAGNATLAGSLTVTSGTLAKNTRTLAVAGNLAVNSAITGTTGNITLSGAAATIDGTGTITTTTGVLTITNAKTILATANLTIASPITLSAATTVTNNGIINETTTAALNGANATTSIWVNAAGSTLNYAGTAAPMATGVLTASAVPNTVNYTGAAQAVEATIYHHLGFGGSAAKTAAAGLTVNGDLTLSGSATFAAGTSLTHTFLGSWIVNTTAATPFTFTTTSIINFNTPAVPAPTSVGGTTAATLAFADVNINNTSGVTFNDNASFSSGTTPTLTVAAGATLTPAAAVIISGTGTLTGTGTVQVTRTAAVANFASQYTIATKTLTNLTVDFAGVGTAQTVDVLTYGSATGGGLKVSNASGVSLTANTTVAGTLTLASGAVSTGAFTLIVSRACNAPSVVRTGGHVAGFLQKNIPVGAPVNCTFEVGDAATYRPIDTTFVSVTVAGNLVGSVSQAAGEHPQCCGATPFGLDSAKDVNRYWTLTNPGGIVFTTYSATFNFINPTDFDAGATPANFEVENWSGAAWLTPAAGTRTLTSTQASGIAAFGDFAVGEKKPGSFNAFETGTAAGATTGFIKTRIAGNIFSLDVVAIRGGAQMNTFTNTVKVELLGNTVTGIGLDGNNCPLTFSGVQTVSPNPTITAGRSTVSFAAVADAWKDTRVRVSYPAVSPTVTSCSTDNFAIRPNNLSVSVTDTDWQTAGNTRTLNNSVATGGNVHKAGQPFTISATAQNAVGATTANYAGSPTVKTLACTLPTPTCTNGTLTPGAWSGSGTVTTSTASYNEAGAFNLTLEDQVFASVDNADGSTLLERTIPQSAAVAVGRFVPDHFEVTVLITPKFKTFNAADAACSAGAAPRRTFTYIGQPFGYVTAPQATIRACNTTAPCSTALTTTTNYSGTLWKIGSGTSSSSKDCTTNPNICQFTSSWTGGGNSSSVVESYAYSLTPPSTPGWDNASAATAAATVIAGTGAGIGTGTLAISSSNILAFLRNTTTPQAAFTANITDTIGVQDASEVGSPVIPGNGTITTTTPLVFNGGGTGIAFDAGNEFRYGRLKLSNAYGSELLDLPIPIQTQYWDATTSAFVTNSADNCTTIQSVNIALVRTPVGCTTAVSGNVSFNSGIGNLRLTNPGARCTADITVNLAAEIPSKAYLQGRWTGVNYDQNPTARATFGVYKGSDKFIYMREVY